MKIRISDICKSAEHYIRHDILNSSYMGTEMDLINSRADFFNHSLTDQKLFNKRLL